MTLDYTKMFLIVTEEAVVKGHFTFCGCKSETTLTNIELLCRLPAGIIFCGDAPAGNAYGVVVKGLLPNRLPDLSGNPPFQRSHYR